MSREKLAQRIVKRILLDLKGRCGIGDELEQLESDDPGMMAEMIEELTRLVLDELE